MNNTTENGWNVSVSRTSVAGNTKSYIHDAIFLFELIDLRWFLLMKSLGHITARYLACPPALAPTLFPTGKFAARTMFLPKVTLVAKLNLIYQILRNIHSYFERRSTRDDVNIPWKFAPFHLATLNNHRLISYLTFSLTPRLPSFGKGIKIS